MNLPNKLTLARFILTIPAAALLIFAARSGAWAAWLAAGLVFGAAAITDAFDGAIARKRGLITDFGKLMDPVADKLLVTASFVCLVSSGLCSPWVLIIILAREFLVTSMRLVAAGRGQIIPANVWGKVKTVAQMTAVVAVIITEMLGSLLSSLGIGFPHDIAFFVETFLLWTSAAATVVSGAVYAAKGKDFFADA